jgi:hypothetical protein
VVQVGSRSNGAALALLHWSGARLPSRLCRRALRMSPACAAPDCSFLFEEPAHSVARAVSSHIRVAVHPGRRTAGSPHTRVVQPGRSTAGWLGCRVASLASGLWLLSRRTVAAPSGSSWSDLFRLLHFYSDIFIRSRSFLNRR